MATKTKKPNPSSNDKLQNLLQEMEKIHATVVQEAQKLLAKHGIAWEGENDTHHPTSACNLALYLALRKQELQQLQLSLAQHGLSSLGRCESHVLTSLENIIHILRQALAIEPEKSTTHCPRLQLTESHEILETNTNAILGSHQGRRNVRIMVTLPTEAAEDYGLIENLMIKGMDCARINCAHDNEALWQRMIDNIHHAEKATGKTCKIMMDLPGHKIRTGPIASTASALHIKTKRDALGRTTAPARIALKNPSSAQKQNHLPLEVGYTLIVPEALMQLFKPEDRLCFQDSRGKNRHFILMNETQPGVWLAEALRGTYISQSTEISLQRIARKGKVTTIASGHYFQELPNKESVITLHPGDQLLMTKTKTLGRPARRDPSGHIVAPATIGCSCQEIFTHLKRGHSVWIDDGQIGGIVNEVTATGAMLTITHAKPQGSNLKSERGLNFPNTELDLPPLTSQDLEILKFIVKQADMVAFSFVETLADMETLIRELHQLNAKNISIIGKIETQRAVQNLPDILLGTIGKHPLGIMIARGDLAVEVGGERLAEVQEEILWLCEAAHVPVIWATQVLETLAKTGMASRPELTDAAMSERAECVMLNKGPYIEQALVTLNQILLKMEKIQRKKTPWLGALPW